MSGLDVGQTVRIGGTPRRIHSISASEHGVCICTVDGVIEMYRWSKAKGSWVGIHKRTYKPYKKSDWQYLERALVL